MTWMKFVCKTSILELVQGLLEQQAPMMMAGSQFKGAIGQDQFHNCVRDVSEAVHVLKVCVSENKATADSSHSIRGLGNSDGAPECLLTPANSLTCDKLHCHYMKFQ